MICEDCINGDHNVCRDCPCQHVTVAVGGVPVSEVLAAEAEEAESVADVQAAFEAGEKGVTKRP